MGVGEALVFYLVVGVSVAAALWVSEGGHRTGERLFRTATALAFWPLYLTILLARESHTAASSRNQAEETPEATTSAIAQVQAELKGALSSLDGWAEDVLKGERDHIGELATALEAQAARIHEMDRALAQLQAGNPICNVAGDLDEVQGPAASDSRWRQSERAHRHNLVRLKRIRERSHEDLMGTLAWLRELVSMIHLAKFTGAPASRAEELVRQIAAAVEGISLVSCEESGASENSGERAQFKYDSVLS